MKEIFYEKREKKESWKKKITEKSRKKARQGERKKKEGKRD